jgi:hypothetical protein
MDGSRLALEASLRDLDRCRVRTGFSRYRDKSYEWWGEGEGLRRLVHHSELGDWIKEPGGGKDFWENTTPLARVRGKISKWKGPQAGEIELAGDLQAFFVPARRLGSDHGFTSKDVNSEVTFFLGFSFDGPRAWEVSPA